MTVSEAKEKVCPFMPLFYSSLQTETIEISGIDCICGSCMAWVYTKTHSDYKTERKETYKNNATIDIEYVAPELCEDEKEGYCSRLSNE